MGRDGSKRSLEVDDNHHDFNHDDDDDDDDDDVQEEKMEVIDVDEEDDLTPAGPPRAGPALPWVERYRPKSWDEVAHQTEVVATLRNAVETGRLPHLLFYGPPGSGKTSVALALCRQLWPPSQWRQRVLELNASDERGISVVRDKIKSFASRSVGRAANPSTHIAAASASQQQGTLQSMIKSSRTAPSSTASSNEASYPNPPFKIIILDEADTVTTDAQAALRRIIEAHSKITRFILICNYVTRIITPLASRCAKFRFQPLPPAAMKQRLLQIAEVEQCAAPARRCLDHIVTLAGGDMRRAMTALQSIHALGSSAYITRPSPSGEGTVEQEVVVDPHTLYELVGVPPDDVVDRLWHSVSQPPPSSSGRSPFDEMREAVDTVTAAGYSAPLLLSALLQRIIIMTTTTTTPSAAATGGGVELDDLGQAELAIAMARAEKNMVEGADEYLQLMTVCSQALNCFAQSAQRQRQ